MPSVHMVTDVLKQRYPREWRIFTRGLIKAQRTLAPLDHVRDFPLSTLTGIAHRGSFKQVERYVMFIGASRSGHSLVGSLLNAHPHVVIGHQLHALRYVAAGYRRMQLFEMVLRTERRYGRRGRVSNKGRFQYVVPRQWQGRFTELRVIGDKRGATSAELLRVRPELLDRLRSLVGVPIRVVNVVRNPYDTISTMSVRFRVDLSGAADRYFGLVATTAAIRQSLDESEWLDLRHEDLIREPARTLARLCDFVGVEADEGYLQDCASIVYPKPHQSRYEAPWTPELLEDVERRMAPFPFLEGYRYEERTDAPTPG